MSALELSQQIEHRVLDAMGRRCPSTSGSLSSRPQLQQQQQQQQQQQHWVAIAGGPGSGKTSLATLLAERLASVHGLRVCVIPMDGYHYYRRELDAMDDPAQAHARRGAAFTFNAPRLLRDLGAARHTGAGAFPGFDHAVGDPCEGEIVLAHEADVVLVEGLYLLLREPEPWSQLLPLFDTAVFVTCAEQEARRRIIARHRAAWNWGHAQAAERADANDLPNGRAVIAASERDPARVLCLESRLDVERFGGGGGGSGGGGGGGGGGSAGGAAAVAGAEAGAGGERAAARARGLVAAAVLNVAVLSRLGT